MSYKYLLSVNFQFLFITTKKRTIYFLIILIPITDCTCKRILKLSILYYLLSQIETTRNRVKRLIMVPGQKYS